MMSIYDALVTWQAGEISEVLAFALTGTTSRRELNVYCVNCGVTIVDDLSDEERQAIEALRQKLNAAQQIAPKATSWV